MIGDRAHEALIHEAEQSVVDNLIGTDAGFHGVYTVVGLRPEHFRSKPLGTIYEAMHAVYDRDGGFDRTAALETARRMGVHDPDGLVGATLMTAYARAGDLPRRAAMVRDAFIERRTATLLAEHQASGEDPQAKLETAISALSELQASEATSGPRRVGEIASEVIEEATAKKTEGLAGLATGLDHLDKWLDGYQGGRVYVIGARPGMGKSTFANTLSLGAAERGAKVGIWNLEMGESEVTQRFISTLSAVSTRRFMRGALSPGTIERLLRAGQKLHDVNLWVDDTADLSMSDIRARVRRLHRKVGLDLVVVDYLQLLRKNPKLSETAQIGEISRGLKVLAKGLNIPIIVLSQLNRAAETRSTTVASKRPQLSDLRQSGDIEQDADVVMLLFREDYYDPDSPRAGITEVLIPKHRGGAQAHEGDIDLVTDFESFRLTEPT